MDLKQTENQKFEHDPLTEKVIGCAYTISNSLGSGFLEKVYENALVHELEQSGLEIIQQKPVQVFYKGKLVGDYVADILVEDKLLVELKAVKELEDVFYAQGLNYLKAMGLKTCLLLNFGKPELQIRRVSAREEWLKR